MKTVGTFFLSLFLILFFISIIISQDNIENIFNTKWILSWNATSADYIVFRPDTTFEEYSSEAGNTYYGKFYEMADTVILKRDSAKYIQGFSKSVLKFKIKNNILMPIYSKYGYQSPKTEFDSTYFFMKDTSFTH